MAPILPSFAASSQENMASMPLEPSALLSHYLDGCADGDTHPVSNTDVDKNEVEPENKPRKTTYMSPVRKRRLTQDRPLVSSPLPPTPDAPKKKKRS